MKARVQAEESMGSYGRLGRRQIPQRALGRSFAVS